MADGVALTRPPIRIGEVGRAVGVVLLIAFAELALALVVVDPRLQRLLFLGAAVLGLAAVLFFPLAAYVALVVLVASAFNPGLVKIPVGPLEIGLEEAVLGALFVVALVRPARARWGGVPGAAIAAFLAIIALSGILAVVSGRAPITDVYYWSRPFGMLVGFYVLVRLFPEREAMRRVILAAAVVTALTSIVALLVASPGAPLIDVIAKDDENRVRGEEGLGVVNRVRLPGVALAYALFCYSAVRTTRASGSRRILWLLIVAALAVQLALSLNRNMWVGITVGLALVLVLADARTRGRFAISLVVLVAAGLALSLSSPRLSQDAALYPLVERGATLFDPSRTNRENSLNDRRLESVPAIRTVVERPWLGVGPGAPFGYRGYFKDPSGRTIIEDQLFLHNQYLYLLVIGGVPGFLAFMLFLGSSLSSVVRNGVYGDPELLALGVGVAITMLSAIVSIAFAQPASVFALTLLTAGIAALAASHERVSRPGRQAAPVRTV